MKKISANLLLSALVISFFALAGSTNPALSKCIQKHPIFGVDVYVENKYCPKKPVKAIAVKKKTSPAAKSIVKDKKSNPVVAAKSDKRIMKMQNLLASMGYNPGPVDGFNGPQTRKAAGEFNISNDLPEKASTGSTIAVLTALNGKHSSPEMTRTVVAKAAPPKAVMVSTSAPAFAPASAPARASDSRVLKMQSLLASMGYNPGPVDGFDKPATRQAAADFNVANDLPKKASISSTIAVLNGLRGK
ncbi:MAG: hypothetical protein GY927_14790 [bacterium]|nr:hypothetical protein [bacterium]